MGKELREDRFRFEPAQGKRVPKKSGDGFRPIVVAPIQTRIVQRAVLNKLLERKRIQRLVDTPYSFGGIRRGDDDGNAAVPAAIEAVLKAKAQGLNYVRCADISSFFTRIRKSKVQLVVATAVRDGDFLRLFDSCIEVELSNFSALRQDAERFPIGDLGVAQGSSLSPLMGNILLHDFDREMNEGDCRCLRYIDDIIILAPTERAANARFRRAQTLLDQLGMEFSPSKSSEGATTFEAGFSFLGIELVDGLIRPDGNAIGNFKTKVRAILDTSKTALLSAEEDVPPEQALVATLGRLSGTVLGWAMHYRFCNDRITFHHLDKYVDERLREYLGAYKRARDVRPSEWRELLGVRAIRSVDLKPFTWPSGPD